MGIFRLLLAISVLIAHSNSIFGNNLVGGQTAVQVFYMISGFYMALILSTKYSHSIKTFYVNRLSKIFFTYWPILGLSLIFALITKNTLISHFPQLSLTTQISLIISNLFIIGEDVLMFTGINFPTGNLFFTSNFRLHTPEIYNFLLVDQSWTIALELYFYSLAPYLNKLKTHYLLIIISLSILTRIILANMSLYNDPWSYRFFPNEIALFIVGILLYRFRQFFNTKLLIFLLIPFTLFFFKIPLNNSKILAYILLSAVCIPSLFNLTKNLKFDRIIGELSFPLYLIHQLVIDVLKNIYKPTDYFGLQVLLVSIVLSYLLYRYLISPLDSIRQKRLPLAV